MKKILVIEDNPAIRENTAEILELSNYKVVTAEDGKQGIEAVLDSKPDLILCDVMMPVMDGYGVLHLLHKNTELRNTPFIFLTAKTDREDVRKGMEAGADDYITKPFTATELLHAVESRLQKADLIKQEIAEGIQGLNDLLAAASGQEALQTFIDGRHTNRYKKKQIVFYEGNRPLYLYYVQKGKVKTYKRNDDGKELITSLCNEGEFLGYVSLLEETSYKETAEAIEDCEIAQIPKDEFEELMHKNHEVARKFIKLLARDVTEKEAKLLNIAYNSLRRKVVDALLAVKEKYPQHLNGYHVIHISRENLAAIAGTATESLIRTLSDFKLEKLIDIRDGNIILLNEEMLKRMIN